MTTPMASSAPTNPASANQAVRAPSPWSSGAQGLLLAVALIALELLPLYIWLLISAGWATGDIGQVALPFTYLAAIAVVFVVLGRLLRDASLVLVVALAVPLGVLALAVALRISPAAYGHLAGGPFDTRWVSAFVADVQTSSTAQEVLVLLTILVVAVGWRAVALGYAPPEFEDVLDRFKVCTVLVVVGAVVSVLLPAHPRAQLATVLTFLVPLTVFSGLLSAALSRAAVHREDLRGTDPEAAGSQRWLAMSVVLSGLVALAALIVGSILAFGSVGAGLAQLGPIGNAIDTALNWIVTGIAWVLYLVLSAIYAVGSHIFSGIPVLQCTPPPAPAPGKGTPGDILGIFAATVPCPQLNTPGSAVGKPTQSSHNEVTIIALVLLIAALIFGILWLRRLFVIHRALAAGAITEERESLNGRSLLAAQLRDLFGRRGQRARAEPEEALPAGSVRALYREVLRAAVRAKLGRATVETPDEYGARLAHMVGDAVQPEDIAAMSAAYDDARYGEREANKRAGPELQERVKRVLDALRQRIQAEQTGRRRERRLEKWNN